jgi:transposase-like protein
MPAFSRGRPRGIKPSKVLIKTENNSKKRRNYSGEFKAEAAAPAERHEKPVSRIAADLGINENMPRGGWGR